MAINASLQVRDDVFRQEGGPGQSRLEARAAAA